MCLRIPSQEAHVTLLLVSIIYGGRWDPANRNARLRLLSSQMLMGVGDGHWQ